MLKENINKIHLDALNSFKEVIISEKSSLENGNYIELCINESGKNLIALIKKSDLELTNFKWYYKSNPNNIDSVIVERNSSVQGFINDVKDIFEKNRFDSDYIKSIS
jgi:hypothetical protein